MIEPTVGRIVHYRHPARLPSANPQAAVITDCRPGDDYIDVIVFSKQHGATPVNYVLLWQGEGTPPSGIPYCEWMPYQKGQAAKTESLEMKASQFDLALDDRIRNLEREMHTLMGRKPAEGGPLPIGHGG